MLVKISILTTNPIFFKDIAGRGNICIRPAFVGISIFTILLSRSIFLITTTFAIYLDCSRTAAVLLQSSLTIFSIVSGSPSKITKSMSLPMDINRGLEMVEFLATLPVLSSKFHFLLASYALSIIVFPVSMFLEILLRGRIGPHCCFLVPFYPFCTSSISAKSTTSSEAI